MRSFRVAYLMSLALLALMVIGFSLSGYLPDRSELSTAQSERLVWCYGQHSMFGRFIECEPDLWIGVRVFADLFFNGLRYAFFIPIVFVGSLTDGPYDWEILLLGFYTTVIVVPIAILVFGAIRFIVRILRGSKTT